MIIEIAVTHTADTSKLYALQKAGIAAIEIAAAQIYQDTVNRKELLTIERYSEALLHSAAYKKWLFSPYKARYEYKLRMQATTKKVRHKYYNTYHNYFVTDCPENKRQWQSGKMYGRSYARLWQDCLHCPHCFEIEYEKKQVGFRIVNGKPLKVYCTLGKRKNDKKCGKYIG